VGWQVLDVLATDTLVTLPDISVRLTQSVIPIGAVLFIVAEALSLPRIIDEARRGASGVRAESLEATH